VLVDDHGRHLPLSSLKGRIVLIDFVHIGCPGACPMLTSKFGQVADRLGPALGAKVVLLSVTNDPGHDTPEQLLALAKAADADLNGWIFMTGDPRAVGRVIGAFGLKNEPLPDGTPDHLTKVFLLDRSGKEIGEYEGLIMSSDAIVARIKAAIAEQAAS
jgi:protein SCO1/2